MGHVRLLISTFSADEARSAIRGGADVVDVEDPKADVGMYATGDIANIIYAVRQAEGSRVVRTSVNIGANLLLYSSAGAGRAVPRDASDIRARAGQEALGIAAAMDVGDARPNIIKFGVDGLPRDQVTDFVASVKKAIRESGRYQNHQVIGSFLPIDLDVWRERKADPLVVRQLVSQGVFRFEADGSVDISDSLSKEQVAAAQAKAGVTHARAELLEPSDPAALGFTGTLMQRTQDYVNLIVKGGADGVMIDTPVQAKAARICLVQHEQNAKSVAQDPRGKGKPLPLAGLYSIDDLQDFTDYCEFMGVESWCAGSVQFFHAEALGTLKNLDVMLCRGVVSVEPLNPFANTGPNAPADRTARRIDSELVEKMSTILHNATPRERQRK